MKLSLWGFAAAGGLLWGGALLCVGIMNLIIPSYGTEFLRVMSSVYPFFHGSGGVGNILIGSIDGLVDGAVAGFLFAWLHNIALAAREQ